LVAYQAARSPLTLGMSDSEPSVDEDAALLEALRGVLATVGPAPGHVLTGARMAFSLRGLPVVEPSTQRTWRRVSAGAGPAGRPPRG